MKNVILLCLFALSVSLGFSQTQNALDFDGTNDVVNIGNLDFSSMSEFTVEAWFKTTNTTASQRIVSKDQQGTPGNFLLWYNVSGAWEFMAYDNNAGYWQRATYSSTVENDGNWHHIVGVLSPANDMIYLYIDGVLQASDDFTADFMDDSDDEELVIGADSDLDNGVTFVFDGTIDEVRIWNSARTQAQIRANMYMELDNPTLEATLYAYYQFNETTGTNLPDESSNTNDGTLVNMDPLSDWVTSTAPIPYYTVADGNYSGNTTWAEGQNAPIYTWWPNVNINNNVYLSSWEACVDMNISSGASLTVNENTWLTVNGTLTNGAGNSGLVVKSSSLGTGSLIENSGASATVERYYTGNKWHFISSPISDATANMFTGLYLQEHTESTNAYTDVTDPSELLNVMQGYALWNQFGDATASYTGTLNTGAYGSPNNMTRTIDGDNGGNNLVGNPYCSSIDWDDAGWTKTNMMAAIYVEDDGNWGIYTTGSGSSGSNNQSNFIAPGQGFFVFVNDGGAPTTGTLQMDNSVRVHNNTNFLKNTYNNYIKLKATGNDKSDFTVIHFMEDATPLFDGQYDAYKFFAYDESYPQLYSITDKNLAINALPETEIVQLGFLAGIDGEYEIQSVEINDISEVSLEDTFTGTFTDLTNDSYSFNYTAGDDPNRFILHFTALSVDDNIANVTNIYSYNKDVYVTALQSTNGTIMVYDMMGREIAQASISGSTNLITLNKSGYYVVKVLSDEGIATQKVFIK